MPDHTLDEQLTKYLTDVHSIEEQALAQLRLAPRVAGDAELRRIFAEHCSRRRSTSSSCASSSSAAARRRRRSRTWPAGSAAGA